jgi:iron complex outermembrane receptor protein
MNASQGVRLWARMTAASVIALSSVTAAQAQTAPAESTGGLQEIVVTARKVKERAQDVPITIAAQTGEQLTQNAIRSVADLSAITPGLQTIRTVTNAGSGMFALRGFTQTDNILGRDEPVTVYVDNVFNEGASGVVGAKLYDIERVEVLKGPQGTLFGRNSTGGAVQIFTKSPTDRFEAEVLGGLSHHPEGGARLAGFINLPLGENAALRITAEYDKEGGWVRVLHTAASDSRLPPPPVLASPGLNSGWAGGNKSYMVRAALKLEPTDRLHVMLRAGYNRLVAEALPEDITGFTVAGPANLEVALELQGKTLAEGGALNPATIGAGIAALNSAISASTGDQVTLNAFSGGETVKTYHASGELTYDLSDNVSIKSITGWRRLTSAQEADVDSTEFALIHSSHNKHLTEFSEEVQINANLLENRLKLVGGGYYYHTTGDELYRSATLYYLLGRTTSTTAPSLKRSAPALFGQATVGILPNLNLTGGLRYTWDRQTMRQQGTAYSDWFTTPVGCTIPDPTLPCDISQKANSQALSWLGSVDYKPTPDTMLFFKVARGFKSGGNQSRINTDPTSNEPYRPEFVTEYEGGIKSEWFDHRLRINASYFVDDFTDAQRQIVLFASGSVGTTIRNVASAKIQGADVEGQFSVNKQLTVGGTLGYLKGKYNSYNVKDSTGALVDVSGAYTIARLPKWSYTLWANFKQPTDFGFVNLSMNWRWVDRQQISEGTRGPESRAPGIPTSVAPVGASDSLTNEPGYGLLNGRLAVHLDSANTEVALWGSNLLDKKYHVYTSDLVAAGLGYVFGPTGPRRAYGIEVSKRF